MRAAVQELRRLPAHLAQAKLNLKNPARTWTENALYQAYYARPLLRDYVPTTMVDRPDRKRELTAAAGTALDAVRVTRRVRRRMGEHYSMKHFLTTC